MLDAWSLVQHTTGTITANTVNIRHTGYSKTELVSPAEASQPISIAVIPGVMTLLSMPASLNDLLYASIAAVAATPFEVTLSRSLV